MEFDFPLRSIFPGSGRFYSIQPTDVRKFPLTQQREFSELLDSLGRLSSRAQNLPVPITSAAKFSQSTDRIYFAVDLTAGNGLALGFIRIGEKNLFIHEQTGKLHEIHPAAVLDFYVHENFQRIGIGRNIFYHMLWKEGFNGKPLETRKLAFDRPSNKLLEFLKKYFSLSSFTPQTNKFVVFHDYFRDEIPQSANRRRSAGPMKNDPKMRNIALEENVGVMKPYLLGGDEDEADDSGRDQVEQEEGEYEDEQFEQNPSGNYDNNHNNYSNPAVDSRNSRPASHLYSARERISTGEVYRTGAIEGNQARPISGVRMPAVQTIQQQNNGAEYDEPPPINRPRTKEPDNFNESRELPDEAAEIDDDDDPNYGDYADLSADDVLSPSKSETNSNTNNNYRNQPPAQSQSQPSQSANDNRGATNSSSAAADRFAAPSNSRIPHSPAHPIQYASNTQTRSEYIEPLYRNQGLTHSTSSSTIGRPLINPPQNQFRNAGATHMNQPTAAFPLPSTSSRPVAVNYFQTSNQAAYKPPKALPQFQGQNQSRQAVSSSPQFGRRAVPIDYSAPPQQPQSASSTAIPNLSIGSDFKSNRAIYQTGIESGRGKQSPYYIDQHEPRDERFPPRANNISTRGFAELLTQQERVKRIEENYKEKQQLLKEAEENAFAVQSNKWSQGAARKKIAAELRAEANQNSSAAAAGQSTVRPDSRGAGSSGPNSFRPQVGAGGLYSNRISNETHAPTAINYGMKTSFQRSSAAYGSFAKDSQGRRFY